MKQEPRRRYKRDQGYHPRDRHIYALLFPSGHAYIGQTVDLNARIQQHRRPAGGWGSRTFEAIHLDTRHATHAEAEDYEQAWRERARREGWGIYGKPPGIVVDPRRRMTKRRYQIASKLKWPRKHRKFGVLQALGWGLVLMFLLLVGLFVLGSLG